MPPARLCFTARAPGNCQRLLPVVADVMECILEDRPRPEIGWSADEGGFVSPLELKGRWYFRIDAPAEQVRPLFGKARILEEGRDTASDHRTHYRHGGGSAGKEAAGAGLPAGTGLIPYFPFQRMMGWTPNLKQRGSSHEFDCTEIRRQQRQGCPAHPQCCRYYCGNLFAGQ